MRSSWIGHVAKYVDNSGAFDTEETKKKTNLKWNFLAAKPKRYLSVDRWNAQFHITVFDVRLIEIETRKL